MDMIQYKRDLWKARQEQKDNDMRVFVRIFHACGLPTNEIVERLAQGFDLTTAEAERVYYDTMEHQAS